MSHLDWSRLLKQQSQHIQSDNRIERQRKQILKQLYRKQLEKMIKQQHSRTQDQKIEDLRILKQASDRERMKVLSEQAQARQIQKQKIQMARTNIKSLSQKKAKIIEQSGEVRDFYNKKYQKINTQIKEQNMSKIKHKQQERNNLSKSYDRQISQQKNRELLQKLEDEKYVKLRQEVQQKKEQNRKYYINKNKGLRQNPQVYELSRLLSEQKQKIKINFLKKIQKQEPTSFLQLEHPKIKQQEEKIRKIIQTSKYNKNYFQNRRINQRISNLKQTAQFAHINKTIEQQINSQRVLKLKELQRRKNMLKYQLDRQIAQSQARNSRRNILEGQQQRINRSGNIPPLPGLVKDYSNEKKFNIMKGFLGGSSKSFQPYF